MRSVPGAFALAVTGIAFSALLVFAQREEQLEALEERAIREAAALAAPSLVRIETVGGLDLVGDLLTSSGPTTGVVVGAEGWIVTSSFNFANDPSSILVSTADGRRHPAKIVGSDQSRMLTLLKIDATGLTPLPVAPQEELEVGHWAIALGHTYDQPVPNLSVGLISALGRVWGRAIQTDAKISPANYGGPLVDISGRGMGILVPLSPSESNETAGVEWYDSGIGFAVPLGDVHAVLERLQAGETLKPGLMGVGFADRSPVSGAAQVARVRPGSPADKAGLRSDDVIIEAAGQPVARVPHLRHVLGRLYAGDSLPVKVRRGEQTLDLTLTLTDELSAYRRPLLGVLPARTAIDDDNTGVEVRQVWPDGPAERAGLQRRDRIISINGFEITDSEALGNLVNRSSVMDVLAVTVSRDGRPIEVEITLTAVNGEMPEKLPTIEIPASAPPHPHTSRTGRFVDQLRSDDERQYWAYVPESYNPSYSYGLVIWMHPPGDTLEADKLSAWRGHCERRGLILVGPKTARPEGWDAGAIGFVSDLIAEFQESYRIDPRRIVLHADRGAAAVAATISFRNRDVIRGLSLVGAALHVPAPPTDPDAPLDFHFLLGTEATNVEAIEQTSNALRELAFPVTTHRVPAPDVDPSSAEEAGAVALWIDALDRL